MDKKRAAILGVLLALLIILIILFFKSGGREKIKQPAAAPPPTLEPQPKESSKTIKVVLFFLSEEDDLLHSEEREIEVESSLVRQASQTIEELIKGSQREYLSPLPPETKLRQLFITKEGVAYVDFSKELAEKQSPGSSAEIMAIYSIVNSLTQNFSSIKKVFILVDGGEKETLAGHINLSRPFLPQYSLIAN